MTASFVLDDQLAHKCWADPPRKCGDAVSPKAACPHHLACWKPMRLIRISGSCCENALAAGRQSGPAQYSGQLHRPRIILTDSNRQMWQSQDLRSWMAGSQANPHLGTPADIHSCIFVWTRRGRYYRQIIAIDGGYTTAKAWLFQPQ